MKFRSLSFKLTIWYVIILGIIIGFTGIFLYESFKDSLQDELDERLLEIAVELNEVWARKHGVTWGDAISEMEEEYKRDNPLILVVKLPDRHEKFPAAVFHSERVAEEAFLLDEKLYHIADESEIDDLTYRNLNRKPLSPYPLRIILLSARGPHVIQVGISLESVLTAQRRLLVILFLAGPLLLFSALLGGIFIIRKALSPVKNVVRAAQRISADDLSLRIDSRNRRDEIGALVKTFNEMIVRLEKSVKKIKQFSGDVSHELRTPLTIIRGEVEVALRKRRDGQEYRETLNSVLQESERMEKIIDDLLFLSRSETSESTNIQGGLLLDEVVWEILNSRRPAAESKGIQLGAGEVRAECISGDKVLLERMLANLVDNAVRYTSSGGRIEVSLDRAGDKIRLTVRDTGIGIPEESLPFIFDRFYVVDPSRCKETGGAGLGLAIVKWVAEIHDADIGIESRLEEGTSIWITFAAESNETCP